MPINAKLTFIFNAQRMGWSESWFCTCDDIDQALLRAKSAALVRLKLLGKGATLEGVRVSDEAFLFDSLVFSYGSTQPTQTAARDHPTNAILCRMEATSLYRRQMWLRGVPDSWIVYDPTTGQYELVGAATTAFDNWVKEVKNAPVLQLRVIDKQGQGTAGVKMGIPPFAMGANNTTIVNAAAVSTTVGSTIRLQGVEGPGADATKGVWKVLAVDGASVTIAMPWDTIGSLPGLVGGKIRPRNLIYVNITDGVYQRVDKRDTGKAFFVQAGRRRR